MNQLNQMLSDILGAVYNTISVMVIYYFKIPSAWSEHILSVLYSNK